MLLRKPEISRTKIVHLDVYFSVQVSLKSNEYYFNSFIQINKVESLEE